MSSPNKSRSPRETDTRENETRTKQWQPASLLPDPIPQEGYTFRWVRRSMLGVEDPTNFSRKTREGWEPCAIKAHPEMRTVLDKSAIASGLVETGGVILCKMPDDLVKQREDYYPGNSKAQMESVDNSFMRENDPRMPLFKDRDSKVTFGRGS